MFGLYVHIPFCLQRCLYCDFATYAEDQISVNTEYVDTVISELRKRRLLFGHTGLSSSSLATIYFGGGTPSLLPASEIARIISAVKDNGYTLAPDCEITMEINPATVTAEKLAAYRASGVNRMSVGVQTFSDSHLQRCGRKHSAQDTYDTLNLLAAHGTLINMDLLFALPGQSVAELEADLEIFLKIAPQHISPYCLTVPAKHPMSLNRPHDEAQREMFALIRDRLRTAGYQRYEISNFAKPGFASRHNLLYWQDQPYWGVGLSAHSYRPYPSWGYRFWNVSDYHRYRAAVQDLPETSRKIADYGVKNYERLNVYQSLTDFCHTAMRLDTGLNKHSLRQKFGGRGLEMVYQRIQNLLATGLVVDHYTHWSLSEEGLLVSNQVFAELLFTSEDIDKWGEDSIIITLELSS